MNKPEQKKNKPRDHEFDGIQEYDNDMPRWWVNLFILCIIFSVLYFAWYHLPFFPSKSLLDEYNFAAKTAATEADERREKSAQEGFDYKAALQDATLVSRGKEAFVTTCSPCHANDGGGSVGPNLTDAFWIHGGSPAKIEATINNGAIEKGMPAWGPILGIDKVRETTVYVMTLKGTKPATPKEPQGVEEVEKDKAP